MRVVGRPASIPVPAGLPPPGPSGGTGRASVRSLRPEPPGLASPAAPSPSHVPAHPAPAALGSSDAFVADAFLALWHHSSDAQRCIELVRELRPHLSAAQASWLLDAIVLDGPPAMSGVAPPTAPMTLATCLALLERCDPRPVRAPFHWLLAANLETSPLLEQAIEALPTLPIDVLLRLSHHLRPTHALRRDVSAEWQRRCVAIAEAPNASHPAWFTERLLPNTDLRGIRVGAPPSVDGETLARGFLARGRLVVGPDALAKADTLRRLSLASAAGENHPELAALRSELATIFASIMATKLASSPIRRDAALVAASHVPVSAGDAYGRGRLHEQLATAIQLTHGEVARVVIEVRDRDANARPELRKRLERAEGLPPEPIFPLRQGDGFSASTHSNPILPSETYHELGHAYEGARPDVLSAAIALRGMLALGPARPLNDLAVIHTVATASGVAGMHEKLLRELAKVEVWPTLDSAEAVRSLLAGHGLEATIDKVLAPQDWVRLRPYGARELALPIAAHPYLGKLCSDGSTEIVSVGFEKLDDGEALVSAYLDSPEHVLFTLGCLPG